MNTVMLDPTGAAERTIDMAATIDRAVHRLLDPAPAPMPIRRIDRTRTGKLTPTEALHKRIFVLHRPHHMNRETAEQEWRLARSGQTPRWPGTAALVEWTIDFIKDPVRMKQFREEHERGK